MRGAPFTLLLLMVGAAASPQVAKLPKSRQGTVAQLADEFLRARDFSGVVLMARDGHVLFEKAYGLANRELDVPNKLETKFQLGSVTKQFTAMAVMILVEREKVRLADSICDYVENCPRAWAGITPEAPTYSHIWHPELYRLRR
jgi:CubicO group peptidase (beta-lactamase class C family)